MSTSTADPLLSDPLYLLRLSTSNSTPPVPTTSPDASSTSSPDDTLTKATHLLFSSPVHQSFPLHVLTRFVSSDKPVDLRSIYFAWLKKDVAIPDYIASAQRLSEQLAVPGGIGGKVQNLTFVEKLDLITWLEGASEESEYIKPLAAERAAEQATGQVQLAAGIAPGAVTAAPGALPPRTEWKVDPRLAEIYEGERKMGDRNTILHGIKQTVGHSPSSLPNAF